MNALPRIRLPELLKGDVRGLSFPCASPSPSRQCIHQEILIHSQYSADNVQFIDRLWRRRLLRSCKAYSSNHSTASYHSSHTKVPETMTTAKLSPEKTKVVVITGVSKGLGRALALELSKRGHTIVGCARTHERLLEVEKMLGNRHQHLLKKVDVASDSSVEEFAKIVFQSKGAPDIVVNNASIINRNGKIWELSAHDFDSVLDINVKGTANVMRHFLPHMKQGTIINISSGWGRIGACDVAPYCASKFAIEGLTQAVSKEVPSGVAVVALNPGVINTDMLVSCFGTQSQLYPSPDSWAPRAADVILNITANDNGASLNVY